MYELVQVAEHTYYIECPAKIGIYEDTDGVYVIDSGNDKDAGRKIKKILEQKNWNLKAILNTHSNADHIGGNQFLQKRFDCPIYSTPMENIVTENTILEPSFLYGGYPFGALRHKFLMAQPSQTQNIADATLPEGFEILSLPGHFWDMIGFKTPDDVYFLADCVSSETILNKYHISFIYDVKKYLETLDFISTLKGKIFIPSHTETTENIATLADVNRKKVYEIMELLLSFCQTPSTAEELLTKVFDHYQLVMDASQYVLVGSTIRSYLSYLVDEKKLMIEIVNNRFLFHTAE
ncbi:MAG: MBL fold metallo-hydrolase [Firmicutes bacterium]|jgi:glyoxylase-like metal-dependent hydrolase (beta-lactamase superfamily II)|nr:MBL fold metallo-hydrolase [Bacillota bacterium]